MLWAAYVDLSRRLTTEEERAVADALEEIVPASGCVGPNATGTHEVYFTIDAPSPQEAEADVRRYMDVVIGRSHVTASYTVVVQPQPAPLD